MKKFLLTIIYPFWYFLGKTWIGGILMIFITLMIIPLILYIIFPDLMNSTGEEAEGIGQGIALFSLLCSPFIGIGFMMVSDYLESNYEKWNYKIY